MREILFRGKRIDNGEWVKGMPCSDLKGGVDSIQSNIGGGIFDVIPETVGQYTGLKDKNGRRIFEGDIVRMDGNYLYTVEWYEPWAQHLFCSKARACHRTTCLAIEETMEVIGNIHDNPELLEDT